MNWLTPWGPGTVKGGQLNVYLDGKHPNAVHENEHTVTLGLDKVGFGS